MILGSESIAILFVVALYITNIVKPGFWREKSVIEKDN
jgi:hypothetical protein